MSSGSQITPSLLATAGELSTVEEKSLIVSQFSPCTFTSDLVDPADLLPPQLLTSSIAGFSHLVASRGAIMMVAEHGFRELVRGQFYGMTVRGGSVYAFEALDPSVTAPARGRILRLAIADGRFQACSVVAAGFDSGCHQIDFVRSQLCVIDTYQQQIICFDEMLAQWDVLKPLPPAVGRDWAQGYVHCNSVLGYRGHTYLLLHNGGWITHRPSLLVVVDAAWNLVERRLLPGFGCHNLVFLEDGSMLLCDSLRGNLISARGLVAEVDSIMTRGLSVCSSSVVVGASQFAIRRSRRTVAGRVHFLDRCYRSRAIVEVPFAPTEIRRIDGMDFSISDSAIRIESTSAEGGNRRLPSSTITQPIENYILVKEGN